MSDQSDRQNMSDDERRNLDAYEGQGAARALVQAFEAYVTDQTPDSIADNKAAFEDAWQAFADSHSLNASDRPVSPTVEPSPDAPAAGTSEPVTGPDATDSTPNAGEAGQAPTDPATGSESPVIGQTV